MLCVTGMVPVVSNTQALPASTSSPPTQPTRVVTTALRGRAMRLAALAGCDARTALRALQEGPSVIRVLRVREDVERALRELDTTEVKD